MITALKETINKFDNKVKKIMINGLYFSLIISIIGTCILASYISFYHSDFIYHIGLEIIRLSISFAVSFISSAFFIDRVKKDLI